MRHASVSQAVPRSELGVLVDAEQRLDRAIEDARAEARLLREAAEQRAAHAREELAIAVTVECERVEGAVQAEAAERIARIEADARALAARYGALRGAALDELAREIEERLVAMGTAEVP